jgi:hypothetical protein
MIISVVNHTRGRNRIEDSDAQRVLRAINRQLDCDFAPHWSRTATLRLEGRSTARPSVKSMNDMRGHAILYLWDEVDVDDAVGYHDLNNRGIPYGFVFTELSKELGEHWSVTMSHEALELVGDPEVNLLVAGPHPKTRSRDVLHWYEMCDAVQTETYDIDGVEVSNFVLPLYFTGGDESGGRNDFLGRMHEGKCLGSFGVNPGGYVGFFDPELKDMDTFDADDAATHRRELKSRGLAARRGMRYRRFMLKQPLATRPAIRRVK